MLVKFPSLKRGVTPRKKKNQNSCGYAHLHIKSFITTKFQEILLSGFREVALTNCFCSIFHFGQISKLKKGVTPKKNESKFRWICASTHYVLYNYKVSRNSVERFQRRNRTDGLTDWQTDWRTGQKHYTLRNSLLG
mgnify:CR=1 FL=1